MWWQLVTDLVTVVIGVGIIRSVRPSRSWSGLIVATFGLVMMVAGLCGACTTAVRFHH